MITIESIGAAAFLVGRRGDRFVYEDVNSRVEQMTGLRRAAFIGRTPADILPEDAAAEVQASYARCFDLRQPVEFERVLRLPRGELVSRTMLTPLLAAAEGEVAQLLGVSIDVTAQHRLQEALKTRNARLDIAVDALGAAHWYYDAALGRFELSPGFERLVGAPIAAEISMDEWLGHVHPDDRSDTCFADIMAGHIEQGTAEFRVTTAAGDTRWMRCRRRAVRSGTALSGIAGVIVDVTQDKRREAALALQAASDPLTGLANRRRFDEVLGAELVRSDRDNRPLSLMMIDVDRFKSYNDTYGHVAGDVALKRIAASVAADVEQVGGLAARYGGEEFVALLPGLAEPAATDAARTVLASVTALGLTHDSRAGGVVSVSIGVATRIPRAPAQAGLVERADAALYRAKHLGRNRFCLAQAAPPLRGAA